MDFEKTAKTVFVFFTVLMVQQPASHGFKPRRILFTGCYDEVPKPITIFINCINNEGICKVRRGMDHTLEVFFKSDVNSTYVETYAAWNNSFLNIPLPYQESDACKFLYKCPVTEKEMNSFTYNLTISKYWPAEEFPVIWKLSNSNSTDEILCFKFKVSIK